MTKPAGKKLVVADASRGLDVAFATKALRELCEREAKASKALGAVAAQRLKQRLADFFAAKTVAELPRVSVPQSDSIEIEVELQDNVVMVFRANHNDTPATPDGLVDWHRVTRIQILHVGSRDG